MKSPRRATAHSGRMSASISRAGSYFFLIVGLIALGYAAYVVVDAHAYQAHEQSKFEDVTIKKPPALLVEGGVIGEIQVPRLQLKAIVVQGDTHTILRRAVGHVPETALPGTLGNVVLAGHRDTFSAHSAIFGWAMPSPSRHPMALSSILWNLPRSSRPVPWKS
jgi:hypothetical protein